MWLKDLWIPPARESGPHEVRFLTASTLNLLVFEDPGQARSLIEQIPLKRIHKRALSDGTKAITSPTLHLILKAKPAPHPVNPYALFYEPPQIKAEEKPPIPLEDIARELGISGNRGRNLLRKRMDKPRHGWRFHPDEVDGIRQILSKRAPPA